MYSFSHLLNRPETHDVIFSVPDGTATVGFCKTLLLGVSEVWNSRDEHWQETTDHKGRVVHHVELEPESAQAVLDALQAAVFTGELPDCSWNVLLQLARLADAELMPPVLDLVQHALENPPDSNSTIELSAEEVPDRIQAIDATVGHMPQLQNWVSSMSEQLAQQIADDEDAVAELLNSLAENSVAALGVLKAAWPGSSYQRLPRSFEPLYHAILRHSQVMLTHPSRAFLTGGFMLPQEGFRQKPLHALLSKISHSLLGSPAEALSSEESLEEFCNKVSLPTPIRSLWNYYVDSPDKDYLRLMLKVAQWQAVNHTRCCALDRELVALLCGGEQGMLQFTTDELQELVLPVLHAATAGDLLLVNAVESLISVKQELHEERRLRQQLEQRQQEHEVGDQPDQQHEQQQQQEAGAAAPARNRRRRLILEELDADDIDDEQPIADMWLQLQQRQRQQQQQQQQGGEAEDGHDRHNREDPNRGDRGEDGADVGQQGNMQQEQQQQQQLDRPRGDRNDREPHRGQPNRGDRQQDRAHDEHQDDRQQQQQRQHIRVGEGDADRRPHDRRDRERRREYDHQGVRGHDRVHRRQQDDRWRQQQQRHGHDHRGNGRQQEGQQWAAGGRDGGRDRDRDRGGHDNRREHNQHQDGRRNDGYRPY